MDTTNMAVLQNSLMPNAKLFLLVLILSALIIMVEAQTTAKTEVDALRAIASNFGGLSWNFSVDPCSGLEAWNDTSQARSFGTASGVNCSCNYDNNTTCHVLALAVVNLDATGQIPPEIGNFTHITYLNLAQNILTGTLPEEIGKLVTLTEFTVGINRLSGSIPPQFGNLTSLTSIGLGSNNFSGPMPKEFGNLRNLTSLYMDSSGLGDRIPTEFGNLERLVTWHGYGNNFNGSIPDIFGKMANLQDLRLYGNNFEGPIPSSLWNLTKLKTLYLGDMSSNSSIPSSIVNLKSLTELSIRNSGLTGTLPVELGSFVNLSYMDLSFNHISGGIPTALGSLASLETLYLANNNLTGQLPSELGNLSNLIRLDVSYNQLSGKLPEWTNNSGLQSNFIWNFFNTTSTRLASAEFNCLDGKSPCTRTTKGNNNNFSINCGGSATGLYDQDQGSLGGASFTKSTSGAWAVSNAGWDSTNFKETITTSKQITDGSELYQTARCSPDSLRYYGLNMLNGNYTVALHFAEISIDSDTTKWKSDGKRIFDIYIQGNRVHENYNIIDKANGSFKAIVETLPAYVDNNVLEIHLKWSGKGTCCTPDPHTHGPLISAIEVTSVVSEQSSSKNTAKVVGITVPLVVVFIIACASLCFWWRRRNYKMHDEDFKRIQSKVNLYTYNEIKAATDGFHPSNKLGEGGFGVVHKGVLPNGTVIAVKELSSKFSQSEFVNEVAIISAVQHRNLVKLLGCCYEGDHRILVFEFLENNSLHQCLLGPEISRIEINWAARFNICIGVARGLTYLHEETLPRIIHRDIKASNVLLDRNLNAKIADFGLAKLFKEEQSHISTRVAGTIGYLSPEYAMRGQLTEKADVYSFGVLILEILSGRNNMNPKLPAERVYLLDWVWNEYQQGTPLNVVDENLLRDFSEEEATRIIKVALLCTQPSPNRRPMMSQVVVMLSGSTEINVEGLEPGYHADYLEELQHRLAKDMKPKENESSHSMSGKDSSSIAFPPSSILSAR